jgi:hypothetical protein
MRYPGMTTQRSGVFLLFLILSAVLLCLPAAAASPYVPLSPSEIGIRQAHLSWSALTRDAEMDAAVTYIYPLYETDATRLTTLLAEFRAQEALIPATTTRTGFDNITQEMRYITTAFRNETEIQMDRGQGKWDVLTQKVRTATINNPYIDEKKAAYWNLRRENQLSDFDAWMLSAQESLDTLNRLGYDTAAAQRTHDVLASKRPDLVAALESKSDDRIASMNLVLLPLSQQLGQQVAEAQGKVSDAEKIQFLIDVGNRAVARADTINNDLTAILLEIGPAEPALKKVKIDLTATSKMLATGNLAVTKTPLSLVKKDFKDLSMAYRDIANSADLPPDMTATLRALVITLDSTADQMEV